MAALRNKVKDSISSLVLEAIRNGGKIKARDRHLMSKARSLGLFTVLSLDETPYTYVLDMDVVRKLSFVVDEETYQNMGDVEYCAIQRAKMRGYSGHGLELWIKKYRRKKVRSARKMSVARVMNRINRPTREELSRMANTPNIVRDVLFDDILDKEEKK